MKVKKVIDNKLLVSWYEFKNDMNYNGIIVPERYVRDVRINFGTVLMIGENVKDINVGDQIMYAVGSLYLKFDTDDGEQIIIPRADVLAIVDTSC